MKRLGLAIAFCLSLIGGAFAQGGMGPGPGTVHSAGGAFAGSGDTVSGAFAYWSCARAYTTAYASGGGNACDIIRASDSFTCTVKFNSTGFADVSTTYCNSNTQTVTQFCNATTCKVTKAYDQSGATNCTTACDATQATDASRPVLNLAGLSSKVCMTFSGGQSLNTPNTGSTVNQPFSGSYVASRTGTFTTFSNVLGGSASSIAQPFLYNNAANQGGVYAGNLGASQAVSITDSTHHALAGVINTTSSIVVVDGAATTGLSAGVNVLSSTGLSIGNGNNPLTGQICEARFDAVAYNATQYGNLSTNQHGTSGYNF